jgi:hypothetical protein
MRLHIKVDSINAKPLESNYKLKYPKMSNAKNLI